VSQRGGDHPLVDALPVMIRISGPDGLCSHCNPSWCEITGQELESQRGEGWLDRVHPDDRAILRRVLETSRRGEEDYRVEYRLRGAEGEDRWVCENGRPWRGDRGELVGWIASCSDVTGRKRLEDVLREIAAGVEPVVGKGFFGTLVEHLAATLGVDHALVGRLLPTSPSKVETVGYWSRGQEGATFVYDLPGTPCEGVMAGRMCIHGRGVARDFPRDGMLTEMGIEAYAGMPLVGKSGEVIGLIAILDGKPLLDNETVASALQVFAERAAAELDRLRADEDHEILAEQLRHSQKMEALGLLAGGVAHDFNSLLTAILGASDLILSSAEGWLHLPEEVRLHVAHIRSAARRGTSLTRQLLAFTRKEILRPEPLDLGRVVVEMEPLFRRLIGEHHELAIEAEKRITVHGDRGRIEQIVMNLVLNGADALKTAGRISMEVSSRVVGGQQEAILSVRDNGVGMTEQVQSRIFEPFFTTKPVGKGTGLGLSVVFGEVERLNGRIEVTSSPGKGSEFRVYLPIVAAEPTAGEEPIEPPRAREGETILLCEDEELVRLVTCQTLRIAGFTVLEARDGREALDVARSADMPVDLLISDVIMPRMNGGELVQALRAQWPDLAVLFVSGYTADVLGKDLLANEDQQFLAKPYGPGVLLRVVRDTLDARRIRKTS